MAPTQTSGFGCSSDITHYRVERAHRIKRDQGLNAQTEEYTDLVKAGIVDPVKTTRSALQNAASIASMVLATDALVAAKPERKLASTGAARADDEGGEPERVGPDE